MWNQYGYFSQIGVLDFAGGNVVHISSGSAGLAITIISDKLEILSLTVDKTPEEVTKIQEQKEEQNNLTTQTAPQSSLILILGTSLLWFCWLGFNGGSSLKANDQAVLALINSNLGASGGLITYFCIGYIIHKIPSVNDMCSGVLAGLVAITPCAGYVTCWGAIIISIIASAISYFSISFKQRYKWFKDPLNVFGSHGIAGVVGLISLGFFANKEFSPEDGILYGGSVTFLANQCLSAIVTLIWSFTVSSIILLLLYGCKMLKFNNTDEFTEYGIGSDLTDYEASIDIFQQTEERKQLESEKELQREVEITNSVGDNQI